MLEAMLLELELTRHELNQQSLDSIYLGGGTPSLLTGQELEGLFEKIYALYDVADDAEITLEANPDDLSKEKLKILRDSPVNRLSIGVQSFAEADLEFMNRVHNAKEARDCIEMAQHAGFDQLSIDLIYGSPTTSDVQWAENLRTAIEYGIPHLSAYCLTVEPKTALADFVKTGKAKPVDDDQAARQFEMLIAATRARGYQQYEISNFARNEQYARHNSSYWQGDPYLGIGPSAHSFDGARTRRWNVANNALYIKALRQPKPEIEIWSEQELLGPEERYNEYVMTGLRTIWGVDLSKIRDLGEAFAPYFLKVAEPYLRTETIRQEGEQYVLSGSGKLLADRIAMELFWEG
ncbi:MAG: coproporphyrinogen III oxidase [Saprospiraceae bacterium]|nr:MAG: coproporphyrinogen III oxidase [Saprospiraceae bacterium]